MLNKLIMAAVLVVLVLNFGDPYAPENKGKIPWLPPAFDDAELVAFKEDSTSFFQDIDLESTYQDVAASELTHDILFFFSELRVKVFQFLIELGQNQEMLAQAGENQ